jgi:hypothetical protein
MLRRPRAPRGGSTKGDSEMKLTQTLTAAAVTGILAGAAACGSQATPPAAPAGGEAPPAAAAGEEAPPATAAVSDAGTPTTDDRTPVPTNATRPSKHACKGLNDCKGRGGCKTELNSCRGQNECKGRGGCRTS